MRLGLTAVLVVSSTAISASEVSRTALADSVMASIFAAKCKSAVFSGQSDYAGKCQLAGKYLDRIDSYMGRVESRLEKGYLGDTQPEEFDRVRQYVKHAQRDIAEASSLL